jgi:hypothetical protein
MSTSAYGSAYVGGISATYADPYAEVLMLRDAARGAQHELADDRRALERRVGELTDNLARHVKEAAAEGTSLGDVVHAWESVAPSEAHVTAVFQRVLPELLGLYPSADVLSASLDKVASGPRLVREEHPLVVTFVALADHLTKIAVARAAEDEIEQHLPALEGALKEAALGGIAATVQRAAERASGPAAAAAEKAVGTLVGAGNGSQIAGKLTGGLVRHAPLLGTLAAANEVRRHIKYGPTGQALLKHVPGTAAYQAHAYDIAQGG